MIGYSVGGGHVAVIGQQLLPVNTIVIDNAGGARRLARALVSLGYRRFAVLAGPESMITSEDRLTGFRQGLSDAALELPEENVIEAQFTRDGGYVAMTELLDREIEVEVVFAVNDVMAVGATAALRDQGYRVPEDMAVAGFDDISTLRDVRPALTTVRLPLEEMGRRALELALDGRKVAATAGRSGRRRHRPGCRRARRGRRRGGGPGQHPGPNPERVTVRFVRLSSCCRP